MTIRMPNCPQEPLASGRMVRAHPSHSRPGWPFRLALAFTVAALMVTAPLVAPDARAAPGLTFFVPNEHHIYESETVVELPVRITEIPAQQVRVDYQITSFDATAGSDFESGVGTLIWESGDGEPKVISVTLHEDSEYELAELIEIRLLPETAIGADLRAPDVAAVIIQDDDGSVYAQISEEVERNLFGELILFGRDDEPVELTIRLSQMPEAPVTVEYTLSPDLDLKSIVFDGVQEMIISAPPPEEFAENGAATRRLQLIGFPAKQGEQESEAVRIEYHRVGDATCIVCFILKALNISTYWGCDVSSWCDCPPAKSASQFRDALSRSATQGYRPQGFGAEILALGRYRDEMLSQTEDGQFYAQLYTELSPAAITALISDPSFLWEALHTLDEWFEPIQRLVDGSGAGVVVSPSMQSRLTNMLDRFESLGDAQLVEAIQVERARLGLDDLVGSTMNELHQRVATAGTGTPVAETSWGALKAAFED